METKKHFFEDTTKNFNDILRELLDNDIHRIFESLLDEIDCQKGKVLEVA
jgi:hypothetical protein